MMDENRAIEPPPSRWTPPLGALGNRDSRARGAATPSTFVSARNLLSSAYRLGSPAHGGPASLSRFFPQAFNPQRFRGRPGA